MRDWEGLINNVIIIIVAVIFVGGFIFFMQQANEETTKLYCEKYGNQTTTEIEVLRLEPSKFNRELTVEFLIDNRYEVEDIIGVSHVYKSISGYDYIVTNERCRISELHLVDIRSVV